MKEQEWDAVYGDIGDDHGQEIIQTQDGGYAFVGGTGSSYCQGCGGYDILVGKINSFGTLEEIQYSEEVNLGEDITTCEESITLDAGEGYSSYQWSTGETSQTIEVNESGNYSVEVEENSNGIVENNYSMSFDGVDDNLYLTQDNVLILDNMSTSICFWFKINSSIINESGQVLLTNHWQSLPSTNNILIIGPWGDFDWVENILIKFRSHLHSFKR